MIVSASDTKVTLVPATKDFNSKSTPVFCLNMPSPVPTFDAVLSSPSAFSSLNNSK